MDSSVGLSDLGGLNEKLNLSLTSNTNSSTQGQYQTVRHADINKDSSEQCTMQYDYNFIPGQLLTSPVGNQQVCKSAENIYIPNKEINNDDYLSSNRIISEDGSNDDRYSPSRSIKRLPLSSSANPISVSTIASVSHSTHLVTQNIQKTSVESHASESYHSSNELKATFLTQDNVCTHVCSSSVSNAIENGESHHGCSSSPRLSPMMVVPHISGESSDERHEKGDNEQHILREDTLETCISYQDGSSEFRQLEKPDGSRVSDSSRSLDSSRLFDSSQASQTSLSKIDRKESRESKSNEKDKKKSKAWYNVLNPTYKSRSEDLKRLFPDLPSDERLIVDYSCALQRDILVHGRLYVTPNYFCFYSKIFGWETFLSIRCKDIVSMTKEKTALVIPNALQINTESEKHFFTSFTAREKTYLMLFRIWQNALLDQQICATELWQWVHSCYGDELGLTSDDDDYVAPSTEDDMKSSSSVPLQSATLLEPPMSKMLKLSSDSAEDASHYDAITSGDPPTDYGTTSQSKSSQQEPFLSKLSPSKKSTPSKTPQSKNSTPPNVTYGVPGAPSVSSPAKSDEIPTDFSDTNESESDRVAVSGAETVVCPNISSHHTGREVINAVFALPLDTVFTLLFTNSKFMLDLNTARKTYDVHGSPWQSNPETNQKIRQVTYTVTLPTNSFGPKVSHVTETQVISSFSKPGEIYTIDSEACNGGIPYADSFFVSNHWCLTRESSNETRISVWSQVKYKKNVWGFMKSVIDKNAFNGMENLMNDIHTALLLEVDKTNQKRTRRRRRRIGSKSCELTDSLHHHISLPKEMGKDAHKATQIPPRKMTLSSTSLETPANSSSNSSRLSVFILFILLLLNAFLYHRLWALEERITRGMLPPSLIVDSSLFKFGNSGDEAFVEKWVETLHQQELLHSAEVDRWRKAVNEAADFLRKAEESLRKLHTSIPHTQASKLQSLLQHLQYLQQMQLKEGLKRTATDELQNPPKEL